MRVAPARRLDTCASSLQETQTQTCTHGCTAALEGGRAVARTHPNTHAHASAFVSFAEAGQAQEAIRLLQGTHFDPGMTAARGGGARIRASLAVRTSLPPRDKDAAGFREIPLSERRLVGAALGVRATEFNCDRVCAVRIASALCQR